ATTWTWKGGSVAWALGARSEAYRASISSPSSRARSTPTPRTTRTGTPAVISWRRSTWRAGWRRSRPLLAFGGRDQLHEVAFRIAIVLLASLGQPAFREAQGLRRLPGGQHGLGGAGPVAQLRRHALDEALEGSLGLGRFAALGVELPATQLVFVATPALVVFAVVLFPFVDVIQGRAGCAFGQGFLHQERVPREPIGTARTMRAGDQHAGKMSRQLAGVELDGRLVSLLQLFIRQCFRLQGRQLRGA